MTAEGGRSEARGFEPQPTALTGDHDRAPNAYIEALTADPRWLLIHAWYDRQYERMRAVGGDHTPETHRLRFHHRTRSWEWSSMPGVRFLCPRGHRLVTMEADEDHLGYLTPVRTVHGDGRPEAGTPVVFDADWKISSPGALKPCNSIRCPKLTHGAYCDDHAKSPDDVMHNETGHVRMTFRCPHRTCRYSGTLTAARLFMLYATAIHLGWKEIRLPS